MKMKKGEDGPEIDFKIYITIDMIDKAQRDLRVVEKRFKNRGAVLKAKKAACLAEIIKENRRNEGKAALEPYQVALAQEYFKQVLIGVKRAATLGRKKEKLIKSLQDEEEAIEHEAARRHDIKDASILHPDSNQPLSSYAFYSSERAEREAERMCRNRGDYDLPDP